MKYLLKNDIQHWNIYYNLCSTRHLAIKSQELAGVCEYCTQTHSQPLTCLSASRPAHFTVASALADLHLRNPQHATLANPLAPSRARARFCRPRCLYQTQEFCACFAQILDLLTEAWEWIVIRGGRTSENLQLERAAREVLDILRSEPLSEPSPPPELPTKSPGPPIGLSLSLRCLLYSCHFRRPSQQLTEQVAFYCRCRESARRTGCRQESATCSERAPAPLSATQITRFDGSEKRLGRQRSWHKSTSSTCLTMKQVGVVDYVIATHEIALRME